MRLRGRVSKLEARCAHWSAHKPAIIVIRTVAGKEGEKILSQSVSALVLTAHGCKTFRREANEREEVFLERIEAAGLPLT